MPDTLVVAGVSARFMAEAAQRDGFRVVALDLFGDVDTQRACVRWQRIGDPARLSINPATCLSALAACAREPGVVGWVAGPGFEAHLAWLVQADDVLPLIGPSPAQIARLRHAPGFFAALDALALPHPPVRFDLPAAPQGWLVKNSHASGGWHIRAASDAPRALRDGEYCQREVTGVPMSLLFVADGRDAQPVGMNRLLVAPLGDHRFMYRGAIGPLPPDPRVVAVAGRLARHFELRGLASLDFIVRDGTPWLLEVNPRPSASMALVPQLALMRAHVDACVGAAATPAFTPAAGVRGVQILFARSPCRVDAATSQRLASMADCHDVPQPGTSFASGDPVCSLSADGLDADDVQRQLAARLQAVETLIACGGTP